MPHILKVTYPMPDAEESAGEDRRVTYTTLVANALDIKRKAKQQALSGTADGAGSTGAFWRLWLVDRVVLINSRVRRTAGPRQTAICYGDSGRRCPGRRILSCRAW